MDKLLVDIDQVLDDLEESEKHQAATNYAFSQSNCLSLKDEISSIQNLSLHQVTADSSSDQPNDQSTPKSNRQLDRQLASESRDRPSSIGTSASPFAIAPGNDSIYESSYEPAYESFKKLNLADLSSPAEQSPNDEELYVDKSSSNQNRDKSSDIPTNSTDKSSTDSSNHNDYASCLSGNPPNSKRLDSDRASSSLRDGEEPNSGANSSAKPNYQTTASLSDTTRTCEQSKTQSNEQANENSVEDAKLSQQFPYDNLLLSDVSLLSAADASGLSVFKENLVDFGDSVHSDLESAVIRDKEIKNAADEQTSSSSLVGELLIEQGSINEMSSNPFEPDAPSASSSRLAANPFEDDDHNLDSNLGCRLGDDNDAYNQRSANAGETHLAGDSSCSVNSRPLTATGTATGTSAPPAQQSLFIQQSGPSTACRRQEESSAAGASDETSSSFSHSSTANGHQTGVQQQAANSSDTLAASNSLLLDNDSFESSETVNTSYNGDDLNHEISGSANIDDLLSNSVGYVKPYWIPDKEAPACMCCSAKFNLIVRRHHCRGCGQVFCSSCCHYYIKLPYLSYKEGRICKICVNLLDCLKDGEVDSRRSSRTSSIFTQQQNPSISDLSTSASTTMGAIMPTSSSQIRPVDDSSTSAPILVPVLKKLDRIKEPQTAKQVIFEDGIRPGGDLTESSCQSTTGDAKPSSAGSSSVSNFPSLSTFSTLLFPSSSGTASSPKSSQLDEHQSAIQSTAKNSTKNKNSSYTVLLRDLNGKLPPVINSTPLQTESTFADLISYLDADEKHYLRFQITKNLCINVNRVKLDCCTQMVCWVFTSDGLSAFGQDEILIVLEGVDAEIYFPRDVLRLYLHVYDNAFKGKPMSDLNLMLFEDGLFENKDNSGFIFFRPTVQCLNKIRTPQSPFLVGLGILKWEIPWAKSLPLRLLLRLGSQTGCYPCPIVSQRSRKTTFHEIGHTIMNVLADFRNFQYTLPFIPGLNVHLIPTSKKRKIVVKIAKNRHDLVLKALNSSNDYVLAFGSNLEPNANYHLTCGQNDEQYLTQILSKDGRVSDFSLNNLEKSTEYISELIGASYIVFSGALKSEPGLNCKFSVVEDGVLVQLLPNLLEKLKNSLKQKTDFNLNCIQNSTSEVDEVQVVWTDDDLNFNLGVTSQIDGRSLEGVQSIRIYNGSDCIGERYLIRWTELFFLQYDQRKSINSMEYTRMAGTRIAQQLLVTLTPHLSQLVKENIKKISLRVNLNPGPDDVDNYAVATNVGPMPNNLTTELDSGLIPLIIQLQGNSANELDQALIIELIFFILNK